MADSILAIGAVGLDQDPEIVVVPVPYDSTASWGPGARFGPEAIISASNYVETYDEGTARTIQGARIALMEPVEPHVGNPEAMAGRVDRAVTRALEAGAVPVVLGGDHSVTIGAGRAVARWHGGSVSFLHIDAHGDMRDSYEGSRYSHACTARRLTEMGPVVQVGIRSISEEEVPLVGRVTKVFWARDIVPSGLDWIDGVIDGLGDAVYITFDVDALDPSIMPATGTPEPGGLSYHQALELITRVMTRRQVVGLDFVELAPVPGLHHPQFTVARLLLRAVALIAGRDVR